MLSCLPSVVFRQRLAVVKGSEKTSQHSKDGSRQGEREKRDCGGRNEALLSESCACRTIPAYSLAVNVPLMCVASVREWQAGV